METLPLISIILSALTLVAVALFSCALLRRSRRSGGGDFSESEAHIREDIKLLKENVSATVSAQSDTLNKSVRTFVDTFEQSQTRANENVKQINEQVLGNVREQAAANEKRINEMKEELRLGLGEMKEELGKALDKVREDNTVQLDKIRGTVDEKLSKTLNERLETSFKNVSDSLDKLYKNLGELKSLDNAVTDLNKTLTGVKTRGNWGELSLESLLSDMLTSEQYERQSSMGRRTKEMVDFAVVLPGSKEGGKVYLPIDSKFPVEDFQRMNAAFEAGDSEGYNKLRREFESSIKRQAASIKQKYIAPPNTTDFAVMYLPMESLYAEVLRLPGLAEEMQTRHRVIIAGPTNAAALINSLRLGFRTLQIQKNSGEVFKILVGFKKQFDSFREILGKMSDYIDRARKSIFDAETKTDLIQKTLSKAEGLGITEGVDAGDVPPTLIT